MEQLLQTIKKIPGVSTLFGVVKLLVSLVKHGSVRTIFFAPPGHFYSPLPSLKEVRRKQNQLFRAEVDIKGVDLNTSAQLTLLKEFRKFYSEIPFNHEKSDATRYYLGNSFFTYGDGIILYSFLRHFQPKRIIEVGSGYSSAIMLDVNELFLQNSVEFTFVEPKPRRLYGLLTEEDRKTSRIFDKPVQDVPLEIYKELEDGDFFFVDSSHIMKVGSDVNFVLFEILPLLKPGVIIHFHDIHWPFEYPKEWLLNGRALNETYGLRAFLQYNNQFEMLYFNSYVGDCFQDELKNNLPDCLRNTGGGLWLRKKS